MDAHSDQVLSDDIKGSFREQVPFIRAFKLRERSWGLLRVHVPGADAELEVLPGVRHHPDHGVGRGRPLGAAGRLPCMATTANPKVRPAYRACSASTASLNREFRCCDCQDGRAT